jgi:hypothetical protein
MQIPYTKFESLHACLGKLIFFLLLTIFFFTTDCLKNEHLQLEKENVKRRFDKHMGKELLKGQPWKTKSASSENNCPFICVCTLEDLPQQKNPTAFTSFRQLFLCSRKKTVGYLSEGSCIQGFSWGSGKPLGSQPKVPQQNPLVHELSLHLNNLKENS